MSVCIGFLEYTSIGKGIEAADLISKNTAIEILLSSANCPGRYQILFTGDVDAVKSAVKLAEEIADFNFFRKSSGGRLFNVFPFKNIKIVICDAS